MATIEARGLRKTFGATVALDRIDLRVQEGRILGLVGPNGAGKTTALNAILGLTSYEGELKVLGRDPWTERNQLMQDVSFIADVAVLPRWIRVAQLLDYVGGVHPRFDRAKAEDLLAKTAIKRTSRVRELSKGMVAQLHLAVVMAIDAKLLVLDEPTAGVDAAATRGLLEFISQIHVEQKLTVLLVTHDLNEALYLADQIALLSGGRLIACLRPDEFLSSHQPEVQAYVAASQRGERSVEQAQRR